LQQAELADLIKRNKYVYKLQALETLLRTVFKKMHIFEQLPFWIILYLQNQNTWSIQKETELDKYGANKPTQLIHDSGTV
jgi:hypothetical protein